MNAGQALMLKKIYDYTDKFRQYSIDSLEYEMQTRHSEGQNQETINRSIDYGKAVATAIFEWSKTDGGYQGYLRNFDSTFFQPPMATGFHLPKAKW